MDVFNAKDWDRWRQNARDPKFFIEVICSEAWPDKFQNFGRIQEEMIDFLFDKSSNRKLLSAFRLSFKTTVLLGFFAYLFTWALAEDAYDAIIYNTYTKENAANFQADLKHTLLENELLQWVFPELPKTENDYKTMTKSRIQHGHMKVDFASVETTLVSRHYPKWVNDDLENDKNSRTSYMRAELKKTWQYQKAILMKIKKLDMGLEIETGTPYHPQGLFFDLMKKDSFSKYIMPYKQFGKLTFPEVYSEEDFEEKRIDMAPSIFSAQFELIPVSEEDALCRESWITKYKRIPDITWRQMVIDPGGSIPGKNDPSGITITDTDTDGYLYVVYADEFWGTPMGLIEEIDRLQHEFDPDDTRIEKERYSMTIADIYQHIYPRRNIAFVEHEKENKDNRIWKLRQWYERKRILHNPDGMHKLEAQLLSYTGPESLDNDDLLDSLAYHLKVRRIPRPEKKHYLPSGRVFNPPKNDFDEEFAKFTNLVQEKSEEKVQRYEELF